MNVLETTFPNSHSRRCLVAMAFATALVALPWATVAMPVEPGSTVPSQEGRASQEDHCKGGTCKEHDEEHGEGHDNNQHTMHGQHGEKDDKDLGEDQQTKVSQTPTTEPAAWAQLTKPARTLRIWLDSPPVVAKSSLSLEGPAGPMTVQGLHSMGENDLMARVVGAMPNGEYTVTWTTENAAGDQQTGTWSFSVQRAP